MGSKVNGGACRFCGGPRMPRHSSCRKTECRAAAKGESVHVSPEGPAGSRLVPLTKGLYAIVDDADFDCLSQWSWAADRARVSWREAYYAKRFKRLNGQSIGIMMHREIMQAARGQFVDHVNGDTLDNRRANLRFCTKRENSYNLHARSGESRYLGVCRKDQSSGIWTAKIRVVGKVRWIGSYATEEEAAVARDRVAVEHHGEFASLNFPERRAEYLASLPSPGRGEDDGKVEP